MKSLRKFVEDFIMATPLNTLGMGNAYSTPDGLMSEPICSQPNPTKKAYNKKKKKKLPNSSQYL